jgi:hypothetical protein
VSLVPVKMSYASMHILKVQPPRISEDQERPKRGARANSVFCPANDWEDGVASFLPLRSVGQP